MAREFHPAVITLDIHLPDMPAGASSIGSRATSVTRHIPICVVSTDDARDRALQLGRAGLPGQAAAVADEAGRRLAQLHAYVERGTKRLAVVMPPSARRSAFVATLDTDVDVVLAEDRESARHALARADALVVEDTLPDFGPEDVLDIVAERQRHRQLPVVLYRGGATETGNWNQRRAGLTIAEARTLPELRMQTALWLHRESDGAVRRRPRRGRGPDDRPRPAQGPQGADRRRRHAQHLRAGHRAGRGGHGDRVGRQRPRGHPPRAGGSDIDIVLMDIMMPEMDGIATMQEIRKLPRGRELPMVAVTAKAMKGDRQKCIEAGAWDYISKPVDPRHLMSVLRGWLCR